MKRIISLEELKVEFKVKSDRLKFLEVVCPAKKQALKSHEETHKELKRELNKNRRELSQLKKDIPKLKSKINSFPRNIRRWSERNFGKLIEKVEHGE